MLKRLIVGLCCFFPALYPSEALAAGCEANFKRQGSFPNRHLYFSQVDIQGLIAVQALTEVRKIFTDMGIKVLNEDPKAAVLTAELPATLFTEVQPITVRYGSANGIGTVQMAQTVNVGIIMTNGVMRRQICTVLNRLSSSVARATKQTPQLPVVQSIEAKELARQVSLARGNPARIKDMFGGRQFRVTGIVHAVSETYNAYTVQFEGIDVPTTRMGEKDSTTLRVVCYIPKTKVNAAAAVYPSTKGVLTGTFFRLENHSLMPEIALDDCGT